MHPNEVEVMNSVRLEVRPFQLGQGERRTVFMNHLLETRSAPTDPVRASHLRLFAIEGARQRRP